MNTELNAGGHRRNSSNARGSLSRRQSEQGTNNAGPSTNGEQDESGMRLKWDEANLYLNEGHMGGKMKITEPKTPYAKNYDPTEDEEEIANINAEELNVDELDMSKAKPRGRKTSGSRARDNEIPGLDLGEPEMEPLAHRESDGERRVHVDDDENQDGKGHGEEVEADMTHAEREKHKKFEEARKKHYEMKNIKNLLGYVGCILCLHILLTCFPAILNSSTLKRMKVDNDNDQARCCNVSNRARDIWQTYV